MSHNVGLSSAALQVYPVTIVNYTQGGESFSAADFPNGEGRILSVIIGNVSASQNSLGVPLFPVLFGGIVKLFQFVSGVPTEIPTTTNLNAVLAVLVSF